MKVLVLGGSGMLGHVVVKHFASMGHDVTFTVRHKVPSWMPLSKPVRVMKFEVGKSIPDLTGYDFVVNCIGLIKQRKVQAAEFYQTNTVLPWRLALGCKKSGARLIHVSSDCVFSGKKPTELGGYKPDESLDADDDYGISKALGEPTDAIVVRTSIIGPAETALGLFEWVMRQEKDVPGYENHMWSGVTTLFLAQFMESIMTEHAPSIPEDGGLIQLASSVVTKCLLLQLINDVFDLKKEIRPTLAQTNVNRELIPSFTKTPDIHDQLVELRDWMKVNG